MQYCLTDSPRRGQRLLRKASGVYDEDSGCLVFDTRVPATDYDATQHYRLAYIHLVTEELVVNVASYAYPDGADDYLDLEIIRDEGHITLRFRDGGVPFNPLERDFLFFSIVRQFMDTVEYEYTNGENILTVMKKV